MATYNVVSAKHATLTGATVDTVTFSGIGSAFEVLNKAAAGGTDLTVVYGVGSTPADPTAGMDDSICVPAASALRIPQAYGLAYGGTLRVKLIGNGNAYSVCAA